MSKGYVINTARIVPIFKKVSCEDVKHILVWASALLDLERRAMRDA